MARNSSNSDMSVSEAGRKGGEKTAEKGSEFYRKIGKKGGEARGEQLRKDSE